MLRQPPYVFRLISCVLNWRVCVVLAVACAAGLWRVEPAFSIDWGKGPAAEHTKPPGAPGGYIHWWAATEYVKEGNCVEAIRESTYLLEHPQYSNREYSQKALVLHGQCYEKMGNPAKAMRSYIRALKRYGKNQQALYLLADLYLREGNPKEAAKLFSATLSMNTKHADAARGLASSYLAMGKVADARSATDRAENLGADVESLRKELRSYHDERGVSSEKDGYNLK